MVECSAASRACSISSIDCLVSRATCGGKGSLVGCSSCSLREPVECPPAAPSSSDRCDHFGELPRALPDGLTPRGAPAARPCTGPGLGIVTIANAMLECMRALRCAKPAAAAAACRQRDAPFRWRVCLHGRFRQAAGPMCGIRETSIWLSIFRAGNALPGAQKHAMQCRRRQQPGGPPSTLTSWSVSEQFT